MLLSATKLAHSRLPSSPPNSYPTTPLSFSPVRHSSAQVAPGDVIREVILEAMPKKNAKGNEEIIWSEVRVLQGVDHPNHVPFPLPSPHRAPARPRRCLYPNMFGCLSVGQNLQSTDNSSRGQNITSLWSSLSAANSLSPQAAQPLFGTRCCSRCFCTFDHSSPGDKNQRLMRLVYAQFRIIPHDVLA